MIAHGRTDQRADDSFFIGTAADRDLVHFLTIFLDTENADMADMMMAAGIDTAGNVDVQTADQIRRVVIGETLRQFLRDRNRTRVSERAIVEAGARDDVADEIDVWRRQLRRIASRAMRSSRFR